MEGEDVDRNHGRNRCRSGYCRPCGVLRGGVGGHGRRILDF